MTSPTPIPLASTARSVFLANLHHAYAQTDGSYAFPNSREGDMLKTAKREIEAFQPLLAKVEGEREAAMEILDTVARGFDRSLGRLLVDDKAGAERELKLAIAHVDNPRGYTGKSMAQLRADLAAKEAALRVVYEELEGHVDGTPDCGALSRSANRLVPIVESVLLKHQLAPVKEAASLKPEDAKMILETLFSARSDIWQTARVSESNLTGIDPVFPDDPPLKPNPPRLIHRTGIDGSYAVIGKLETAITLLQRFLNARSALASRADKGGAT